MANRLDLQAELEELLGNKNVYFQPPASFLMQYPCIRYKLSGVEQKRADNASYDIVKRYEIVIIDKDPDRQTFLKLLEHFPMCRLASSYAADNLNHYVLELYHKEEQHNA